MKIKTALLTTTLALTVALATACSPAAEINQDTTAPRSADATDRSTFALVMCLNNRVVQAELEKMDVNQDDNKTCQDQEKRNAPRSFPSKSLDTVYAAMICIR